MRPLTVCALAFAMAACGTPPGPKGSRELPYPPGSKPALRAPGPLSPRIASYVIEAKLDADKKAVTGHETLTWKHTGSAPVTSAPLHLYMNAFKNETTVFMKESGGHHRRAHRAKDNWGWIDVASIKLGDAELRPQARYGEDETTLEVPLPAPVDPGGEVKLDITFSVQLPEVFARTGFKGDFIMVGQWFPKIGVLLNDASGQRWYCNTFHLNSEFFADFGVYDVTLDVPSSETVVGTGVLMAASDAGGRKKLVYHAEDVHDFAWMADPRMEWVHTTTKDGVDVYVYSRPEQRHFRARHLEAATRTIETFGRYFYPYPWTSMTVIDPPPEADDAAGGMEYPTLVTTAADRALTIEGAYFPEFVTVHEVGHNWFQGLLASNEAEEAWLDEGMNEYADGIVMEEWKGKKAGTADVWGTQIDYYTFHQLGAGLRSDTVPIATRSWDYPDNGAYGSSTYYKTAVAMHTLENMMGRERFFAALGGYARKWAFKHPTRDDLFDALAAGLGEDPRWFLVPAFQGRGGTDYRVLSLKTRKQHEPRGEFGDGEQKKKVGDKDAPETDTWISEILLANLGNVPAIVKVRLTFADGRTVDKTWDDRKPWTRLVIEDKAEVVAVQIDPDHLMVMEQESLKNGLDTRGDGGASWRAASRASFWEQTAFSLVGM